MEKDQLNRWLLRNRGWKIRFFCLFLLEFNYDTQEEKKKIDLRGLGDYYCDRGFVDGWFYAGAVNPGLLKIK
jgi:hypothetical protein